MQIEDAPLPNLVATIGLHGSASTWVFNVIRELMIVAAGDQQILALYADDVGQIPDRSALAGKHLLIKSHRGSLALDAWLEDARALVFLSVRDPRDASISMSRRFKVPLSHTARWLADDCNRLTRLASQDHHLLMRYEDRFFEDQKSAQRLAHSLGLTLEPAIIEAIFARYRTEAVRSFARTLADLPPDRVTMIGGFTMDRITQILNPHIGDTRSGKWRDLPSPLQTELTRFFRPFLDRFGYLN